MYIKGAYTSPFYYGTLLISDESLNVTRLLVDYPTATASYLYGNMVFGFPCLQNIREVWLSPQVDSWEYINDVQKFFEQSGDDLWIGASGGIMNGFCTIYVSDEGELPKGLLSYSSKPLSPVYFVKIYSGDVYEAFKKGDSAAREWCPGHEYTGKACTASRMKQHMTCQQPNEWYYSCKWCGKCEYNPNHTFSDGVPKSPVHDFARFDISDKNFAGKNKQGENVYYLSCRWCGINKRESVLGDDFTKPLTRLQASAIAVAIAEKLSGKSVSSAKSKTYSDTKSKYALKAAGAGIYGGASEGKFNPDGAVDRQQLATFFYQALMYAKKNKNVRYSPYELKLTRYSDNASIAYWAKEAAAFIDALGLVEGSIRTKFLPEETLTIEQALVIANNSLGAPNIGWYQSGPSDTDKLELSHSTNDFQLQNCGVATQLEYRYYERFWRPFSIPEIPAEAAVLERFAVLDPYTNERLYARKINFFAVKAE